MKKFYSVLLAAVTLLFSANLFAINVPSQMSLQEAVNSGTNVVIDLDNNVSLTATVNIYSGQTITLNLNGHTISGSAASKLFALYHGNLTVNGEGTIENSYNSSNGIVFQVEGHNDYTKADWSVLTIGNGVNVIASGKNGKAIVVDGTVYGKYYTYVKATAITNIVAFDYLTNGVYAENAAATGKNKAAAIGSATAMYANLGYANKFPRYAATSTSTLYAPNSATTLTKSDYLKASISGAGSSLAYGVKITINGNVYGTVYGYKTNGTVGLDAEGHTDNAPEININSTATVSSANGKESAGVASNGPSVINIDGATVKGGTGVYVKAGTVTINDAVIASTYEGTYNKPAGQSSGVNAGGSGIVVESNASYSGEQNVTITGDTKITGSTGYGIEETITTAGDSKVSHVTIEGGTIEAGDQGAMIFDKSTVENEETVQIVGGNVNNNIYVQEDGEKVNATVDQFIPQDDENSYKTTSITDENGKTTIVITKFEDAADMPVDANSVVAAVDNTGINWTVTANTEETLTEDKTLTYLEAASTYKQTLTVSNGATLTVGRVVLGVNAQIIVEAGASLIVTGEQGIVAPVVSNIVLRTSESNPAEFLFNPAVTSNRHPNATVEFTSKAYRTAGGDNIYQFFGSPFTAVESIVASSETYMTQISVWNVNKYDLIGITNNATYPIDYSKFSKKFGFYSMLTNNPAGAEQTYTLTGTLVGNENSEIPLYLDWAAMSNSYTGTINMDAFIAANRVRQANGVQVDLTPYVYRQEGNELHWDANNPLVAGYLREIAPMQPFMLKNNGGYVEIANNYNDLVYAPATAEGNNAPARVATMDMTKATIRVNGNGVSDMVTIAESADFSNARDEFDAVMYPNTDINFYAMAEEKMSVLATDNVENTYLGFACQKGGEFTLTFAGVEGEVLTLIDLKNNTTVDIIEGATYTFASEANEANDYRFQIVRRSGMPTDVENVEADAKVAGIYTLTGQYMGNMSVWNTLPAGVYVVNGEKKVK